MATEVILMEDVDGLGLTGDIVKVADGYARNYLIPRNIAAPVTTATRRQVEKRRAAAEAKRAARRVEAEETKAKIEALELTIPVRAGAEGRLFGSVTAGDIAAALGKHGITVDKHKIMMGHPLKELGPHKLEIRLMPEIRAELKLTLVAE